MSKVLYKWFYSTESNNELLIKRRKCVKKKVRLNNETHFKKR